MQVGIGDGSEPPVGVIGKRGGIANRVSHAGEIARSAVSETRGVPQGIRSAGQLPERVIGQDGFIAERVLNAVAEQTAERTAAAVAEARENGEGTTEELDANILSAAREALSAQGAATRPPRKRSRKPPK